MDPLSELLRLAEVSAHISAGLIGRGRWSVAFDAPVGVKFNAVLRGHCVLRSGNDIIELKAGDCFLLSASRPFVIATDLDALPRPAGEVFSLLDTDGTAHIGGGRDNYEDCVSLIGGRFDFGTRARALLIDQLPPVLHISSDRPEAATIRSSVALINTEMRSREAGAEIVAESVALAMLVGVLRMQVVSGPRVARGLLGGLHNPIVAAAIALIHAQPAHRWTVGELASATSVSRSTLASHFMSAVGVGPLGYLTSWRMELAAHRLRQGTDPISAIADSVGYSSDSAFSVAFKRVIGESPDAFRRHEQTRHTSIQKAACGSLN
ncbi:AraC family transcriptional regulator [Rhodococcus sp. 1R11]|uniref:AraC family transcriptional regulator n=1 Tax=Rhodococcus sp. 1R11 TaxID=2559614 RepID=UPI001072D8A0|nr:AraC family transcriptional regulator [Rhodococcus sp. 1R11]MBX5331871.1 AraC family transcriptional regulator [Rhodococcus fascians]MBY4058089.1 AraC family transcriptional regulator [Rhodococcus fascians]MBY4069732.1 AraC family transcriptional regulator [Rhodococcus fascians]TFI44836.1 AraC family transcriptional regulator [Rhodococcus sp. 1R11]